MIFSLSNAGAAATYIEPGSPWENPFVESFNDRVRDELNTEDFAAQVLAGLRQRNGR